MLGLPGVSEARTNARSGTLLVRHDPHLCPDWMLDRIADLLADGEAAVGQAPTDPPSARPSTTPAWHALDTASATRRLEADATVGLTSETAARRLAEHGANAIAHAPGRSAVEILGEQFLSWPVGLLGLSAVVSVATGARADAVTTLAVVGINAAIGFVTERQAERTINALQRGLHPTAEVIRGGTRLRIPAEDVVPGDLLSLRPGEIVAADARLVAVDDLSMDESSLTGESLPVRKTAATLADPRVPIGDRGNMVFMGTRVTGGSALAVTVATGPATEFSAIQAMVGSARAPETPLQRQLDRMGRDMALLCAGVSGTMMIAGLARGQAPIGLLRDAVALAVAAVPEGLPAIATTILAIGMRRLRGDDILVRQLRAVESLGTLQVVCFDKTGTLTQNRMAVTRAVVDGEEVESSSEVLTQATGRALARIALLCNDAGPAEVDGAPQGSATEVALLGLAEAAGIDTTSVRAAHPRSRTDYRTETKHYMLTEHGRAGDGILRAVKGSPRQVLPLCEWEMRDGVAVPLDEAARRRLLAANDALAGDGLRVLAFAQSETTGTGETPGALTWVGMAGLADPLRPGIDALMKTFQRAGIRTVMVTGDQSATAHAIARELDLAQGEPIQILDAAEPGAVDPELLSALADRAHVFARVSPADKLHIVRSLQRGGGVVGMTGDGINDGPALKAADIGIAMGKGGTDVAREVADVVLEDDELRTLAVAVERGRALYDNVRRSVHYLLSTNVAEVAVMLTGTTLGIGRPLNAMQLLWINLVTDVFPGLGLALEAPEPDVMRRPPRDPDERILARRDTGRMLSEGAAITAATLAAYGYGVSRYGRGPRAETIAFTTIVAAQLAHALTCRDRSQPTALTGKPANPSLLAALALSAGLQGLGMTLPPLRRILGVAPVSPGDMALSLGAATAAFTVNEGMKLMLPPPRPPGETDR